MSFNDLPVSVMTSLVSLENSSPFIAAFSASIFICNPF